MKKYFAHSFFRVPGQENLFKITRYSLYAGASLSILIIAFGLLLVFLFTKDVLGIYFSIFVLIFDLILFLLIGKKHENYIQGIQGEKMVFYELMGLIKKGYDLYASFPGEKFDIDFLLVSPKGVFVIEVKNPFKRFPEDKIIYSENKIKIFHKDGKISAFNKKSPVEQAISNSVWLEIYFKNLIGKKINFIKPIVLFPGFLVEEYISEKIVILNPKRFESYVESLPDILFESEINQINVAIRARLKYIHDEIWKE